MKTKPFNLEEALNGAKVVTRDGLEVKELTKFEGLVGGPIAGVMGGVLNTWTEQGKYYKDKESNSDLFLAAEPQRVYVNVYYLNGKLLISACQYNSLPAAKLYISDDVDMKYIKTIEITDEP